MVPTQNEAQQILLQLTKGVFGTVYIDEGAWIFHNNDQKIARLFFERRIKTETPFDSETIDKTILIYRLAMTGKSKYMPDRISDYLIEFFSQNLGVNFNYLQIKDIDSSELGRAKAQALENVLQSVLTNLKDQTFLNRKELLNALPLIAQINYEYIKPLAVGTDTATLIQRTPNYGLGHFSKAMLLDQQIIYEVMQHSSNPEGTLLFFLNSSISSTDRFLREFEKHSIHEFQYIPTIVAPTTDEPLENYIEGEFTSISLSEMTAKQKTHEICCVSTFGVVCYGYDIGTAKREMQNGQHYTLLGSIEEYLEIRKYVPNVLLFLILPQEPSELLNASHIRGYSTKSLDVRIDTLKQYIEYALHNDCYIFSWDTKEAADNIIKYSHVIDSIMESNQYSGKQQEKFLQSFFSKI